MAGITSSAEQGRACASCSLVDINHIIDIIAEYSIGYIVNCGKMECSKEIIINNEWELYQKSKYNYYNIVNEKIIPKQLRSNVACIYNHYRFIFCIDHDTERCDYQQRYCDIEVPEGVCYNHPRCYIC